MRPALAVVVLLAAAVPLSAQQVDKAKLRQTLKLPTIQMMQGIILSSTQGVQLVGQARDAKEEIARITKELKGDATDAERYDELCGYHGELGDKEAAKKAAAKAVELFRTRLKERPEDGRLLAKLAGSLADVGAADEAEAIYQRAIQVGAGDWYCWKALGSRRLNQFFRAINTLEDTDRYVGYAEMRQWLQEGKVSKEAAQKGVALLKEAAACYDKAVELAPNKYDVYHHRASLGWVLGELEAALYAAAGQKAAAADHAATVSKDLIRAAELQPDEPRLMGLAAISLITARAGKLSPADQKLLEGYIARVNKLAESADPKVAAAALEIRGFFAMVIGGDLKTAEDCYRKTLKLDPSREIVWDMLTAILALSGRVDESRQLCHERLAKKANAHNYFLLAKAHGEVKDFAKVEEALLAGLKAEPDDFFCNLGLAAMLLRRDDDPKVKAAVKVYLDRAAAAAKGTEAALKEREVQIVRAAYEALYGDPMAARKAFAALLGQRPRDEYIAALAQAAGQ
jgi:tetratricopeptide (TPR) repeat protein